MAQCRRGAAVAMPGWLTAIAFANLGSAWSLQALHDLQTLRARYPNRLRALVLHVPRFDHERDARRVMKRAHRHGITLPLALDADWVAWQQFGVRAWPTVFLVDGAGHVQARIEGERRVRRPRAPPAGDGARCARRRSHVAAPRARTGHAAAIPGRARGQRAIPLRRRQRPPSRARMQPRRTRPAASSAAATRVSSMATPGMPRSNRRTASP